MGAFDALLAVQDLDTRIDQLRHRHEALDERTAVADGRTASARAGVAVDEIFARLHEAQNAEKALEDESASLAEKVRHVEKMLYGGTVSAAKELEAYQADLASLQRRATQLDDETIEVMERVEPLEAELGTAKAAKEAADGELERAEEHLLVAEAEIDAQISALDAERAGAVAAVPAEVVELYERLRAGLGGVGAAKLSGARCEGCHLEIPSAQLEGLRRAPADEVITCPECGRILVR